MSLSQLSVLYQVRYGVTTPGKLARRLMVTPKAITQIVDPLVQHGMLHRHNDLIDRRQVQLSVTDMGRSISEEVEDIVADPMKQLIAQLSPSELSALKEGMSILGRLISDLDTNGQPG